MSEEKIAEIAENANMIIAGYAFTKKENGISILNLKKLFTLCFFFSFTTLFAFSEQLPWVMNTELPAKGIFKDEEECVVMGQRGRLYKSH